MFQTNLITENNGCGKDPWQKSVEGGEGVNDWGRAVDRSVVISTPIKNI